MVGEKAVPTLKATYMDNHSEIVNDYATFIPQETGIVEFYNGQMLGVGQGSTTVNASFTDLLGNKVEKEFTAKSSFFPFETRYVRNDFVGASSGTYRNNITSAVFKFLKEKAELGWAYSDNVDMSDYKYLVIEFFSKPVAGVNLNIYTTENLKGACYSSPEFSTTSTEFVLDLDTCKYTSASNKGKSLNRQSVRMVTFKGAAANKQIAIKNMFLSNDETKYNTGITTIDYMKPAERQGIFDLQGRRIERPAKSGIYIINGKKVILK